MTRNRILIFVACIALVGISVWISKQETIRGDILGNNPPEAIVIDDSSDGFFATKEWMTIKYTPSFRNMYKATARLTSTRAAQAKASWIFTVPSSAIIVQANWPSHTLNATNVEYVIYDGNNEKVRKTINQSLSPKSSISLDGIRWETIGEFIATSNTITVELSVDTSKNQSQSLVFADAIRWFPHILPPPICGNAIQEEGETCDDGNMIANDGCTECLIDFCEDSDASETFPGGMNNINQKGKIRGTGGGGGIFSDSDRCIDDTTLMEYGCIGSVTNVTNAHCPYGCIDGRCNTENSSSSSSRRSSSSARSECYDSRWCGSSSSRSYSSSSSSNYPSNTGDSGEGNVAGGGGAGSSGGTGY